MNIFSKIFSTKKAVVKEIPVEPEKIIDTEPLQKNKNFCCHFCNNVFEVDEKTLFSTSVTSTDGLYHFQGVGITCPKCQKNCIYS